MHEPPLLLRARSLWHLQTGVSPDAGHDKQLTQTLKLTVSALALGLGAGRSPSCDPPPLLLAPQFCSLLVTAEALKQAWFQCRTCGIAGSGGVCLSCAVCCHRGA